MSGHVVQDRMGMCGRAGPHGIGMSGHMVQDRTGMSGHMVQDRISMSGHVVRTALACVVTCSGPEWHVVSCGPDGIGMSGHMGPGPHRHEWSCGPEPQWHERSCGPDRTSMCGHVIWNALP